MRIVPTVLFYVCWFHSISLDVWLSASSPPPSIRLITAVPFSHVCLRIKDACAEGEQCGLTLASASSQPRATVSVLMRS